LMQRSFPCRLFTARRDPAAHMARSVGFPPTKRQT
jgi:hypothetical protein